MVSYPMAAWVNIEPDSVIRSPPAVLTHSPSSFELDQMQFGRKYNGPDNNHIKPQSGWQTPQTPADDESGPHTPPVYETAIVQSLTNPSTNKWRFVNACSICLAQGMNDSASGALLPYIENYYHIDYTTVSLLFVATAVGFVLAAPFTSILQNKLARAKMLVLAQIISAVAYAIISSRPSFPAVVVSFFLYGLASAWSLALNNVFVASLTNATTLLGFFHGAYGIGGTIAPLIATLMVSSGSIWFNFYAILLALAVMNGVAAFFVNQKFEAETEAPLIQTITGNSMPPRRVGLLEVIKKRTTLLGAFFIFAYQGAEVSLSGWILSFLLTTRPHPPEQSPSLGYVTAGFWAGITLGRFALSNLAHRIGEKLAVVILTAGATALQVVVWMVPDIIGASVAIALVGLLLGPIYACAVSIFSRLLKRNELTSSLAFISALGSSGGAVAPFITGFISQRVGTWVVNPIAVALFVAMFIAWLVLPRMPKKTE